MATFMIMALIPPAIFVFSGKWHWSEIGFKKMNVRSCKRGF